MALEASSRKLGGSMKVPYVQELVKEKLDVIPPRYVRDDQEKPIVCDSSILPEVPVIDMEKLLLHGDDGPDSGDSELAKLHLACQDWGFFQLINHGVDSSLLEKVKFELKAFFDLTMEEKMKFDQEEGDIEGYGQAFVVSEEQKLDWADLFYMITLPAYLRKPHLIPKLPDSFRDTLEEYIAELKELAMKILHQMAKALGIKSEDMNVLFEEGMQSVRMNYYPPCSQPELVIGLSPHSDPVGLTILFQANEMEGLQIKKDGSWISVTPLPNAFVLNVGDILEIVTNGIYKSIEHRALVNSKKERLSIATFLSARLDGDLGPIPDLITPENPAKFKRIGVTDYFKEFFSRKLVGKTYVDAMRLEDKDQESN